MFITRKSRIFRLPRPATTRSYPKRRIAPCTVNRPNPHGHGHNYILEVTLEGEPDPVTGMVFDLKRLKDVINREVVDPMDHRFLNHEVPPFDRVIPTPENIAAEIWKRLEPQLLSAATRRLHSVRLYETEDLLRRILGGRNDDVTRRYRFARRTGCTRRGCPTQENRRSVRQVQQSLRPRSRLRARSDRVTGPVNRITGRVASVAMLDAYVARTKCSHAFDHQDMNREMAAFADKVPTAENIAAVIGGILSDGWTARFPGPELEAGSHRGDPPQLRRAEELIMGRSALHTRSSRR